MSIAPETDKSEQAAIVADLNFRHPSLRGCPICGADMNRVALVDIGYTFEICHCSAAHYSCGHLAEQAWHRRCLGEALRREASGGGS